MPSTTGIIFDLDGVLIDSEELWDEIRRAMASEHDRAWPDNATIAMQGMSTAEWSHYLTTVVGVPGSDDEVAEAVIDRLAERYRHDLPLLPGAVEVVARLADQWPLGLASSSPRRIIDAVLAAAGLDDAFRISVSTEEVAAGKPSPLVYLRTAELLGVDPATSVGIEDSSNGLRSAAAAGLVVVAVPHPAFPPAADALALARVCVESLRDVTPGMIESITG